MDKRRSPGSALALEQRVVASAVAKRLFGTEEPQPTLGGYELLRRVGAGGMGVVFEARDPRTGQRLALKVLQEHGDGALQRLKREFRVLAHLHHENLVELHELSVDSEQPFLTMELVDGGSVRDYVRPHGALDRERLWRVLRQLVDAVSTLHAAGVVHRDLKPSNLLVRLDGRLVVLDFGVARALELEDPGPSISGTPIYMAPERLRGAPADESSDWYSVGMIACEALGSNAAANGAGDDGADLAALCARLCAADPGARPRAAELRAYFGLSAAPAPSGLLGASAADGVFVGRQAELAELRAALADAAAGRPALVYLSGEPGIGKTALARHFTAALRAEGMATVLAGACYERELIPYNAFDGLIDALAHELETLPEPQRQALVPAGAADLCRVFPSLAPALALEPERSTGGDPQRLRHSAFSTLRELLARLAAIRPLVLQIDDLQWGDADSAQLLRALLEPAPAAPLLLVACYRGAAEQSACVQALQRAWPPGAPGTRSIALGPLDARDSLSLARALASEPLDDARLQQISREASGSPLFLRALLQHQRRADGAGRAAGTNLAHLLAAVLEQLPAPSRRLLELAALAAEPIERRLLLRAAAHESADLPWAEHLASLQHARLLRRVPAYDRPGLEPYHDRVREASTSSMSAERRQRCHAWLAAAAEQVNPGDHEFLAAHHEGAGHLDQAALHAERAADHALESIALERAAALYTQALRCLSGRRPAALLRKLADATAYTGRCADAVPLYLDAAQAASGQDALRLRLQASEMLLRCGLLREGREVLTPVLRAIGLRYPRSTGRALLSAYANVARIKLQRRDDTAARRAPTELERLRTDVMFNLGLRWGLVDPPRTCALLARGYLLARRAGTDAQLARALTGYALVLAMLVPGSKAEQDRVLDRARALAAGAGDRDTMGAVLYQRAVTRFLRADLHGALEWIDEARAFILAQCVDTGWLVQELDTAASCQLAVLGRVGELDRLLVQSVGPIRASGNVFQAELMDAFRGFALIGRDEPQAAIEHSARTLRAWGGHEAYQIAATAVMSELHAQLYADDARAAHRLVQEQWPELKARGYHRAEPWRSSMMRWEAIMALSCVAQGGDPAAFAAVERGIAQLKPKRMAINEPVRRLLQAQLAHARGERERAIALYAAAASGFNALRIVGMEAAARMRWAELAPAEQRAGLRAQADVYFRAQRIARPDRFIRIYAPIGER